MPNIVTELLTRELEQHFEESEGAVLVNYAGLTVKEDSELRDNLAAKGVEFRMVRNKLCKRVMTERGFGAHLITIALAERTAALGPRRALVRAI